MKGNGNGIGTLFRKLYFMMLPTCGQRTRYIYRHRNLFHGVGNNLMFQPRNFPSDPELIAFGNNVMVASDVSFITHDITSAMINHKYGEALCKPWGGVIKVGDNVMIGAKTMILPDVKIGNNVVIAAGSVVTKDIPDNSIVGGVPAKVIGDFNKLVEKRKQTKLGFLDDPKLLWSAFEEARKNIKN